MHLYMHIMQSIQVLSLATVFCRTSAKSYIGSDVARRTAVGSTVLRLNNTAKEYHPDAGLPAPVSLRRFYGCALF